MSSSDDDLIALESISTKVRRKRVGIHSINRERITYGEYHHLFPSLKKDDKRFFQYMRMSQDTFNYILEKVGNRLTKNWCNLHKQPILPEERLVITLRYLATGSSFKQIGFSFRLGASTVGQIVQETVCIIWDVLQPIHMPTPKKQDFQRISEEFNNIWNFPHCIGAIDGKHVRIVCPKNSGSMFYNYKHYFSVVVQGVADANYKFIVVEIGGYGKQSDGGTFQASELYRQLKNGTLAIPEPCNFPQTKTKAPFVLISDEAYPLLPFLLKPFGGRNLSIEEECFNKRLSRARKSIECTFGIITTKWRILSKCIETNITTADNIIKCICILHNTIIDKEGFERHLSEVSVENCTETTGKKATGRPLNDAKNIRDIFVTYFAHNTLSYKT
ncbi:unnamed protein product [Acanthoscelides obtectus]|uniref:DDE Tnp4 domain-containing protein n=1 Tax=Acanthoscelides obtectus TaxID=200917 RepID=A0A9P0M0P7_ACAOB|nr:unnamed protein product [Acanthoscelides obtectus]CAK1680519.1 Protein ALP1-like [Acanthoscelides obtectus]